MEKIYLDLVKCAISDCHNQINYMDELMKTAKCKSDFEVLRQIRLDKKKHLLLLGEIVENLGEEQPLQQLTEEKLIFHYERLMFISLEQADFFRKLFVYLKDTEFADSFLEMMNDSQSHGTQFLYLYINSRH